MELSLSFYVSYVALWILVILQSLILVGLVRMVHELRQAGVPVRLSEGQEAPKFSVVALSGEPISTADFAGRFLALLFVSPDCSACVATLENDMGYLHRKGQGNLIVICKAGRAECVKLAERYELTTPMVADEDEQISRLFAVSAVPIAVLINESNRIQSYGQPEHEEPEKTLKQAAEVQAQGVA